MDDDSRSEERRGHFNWRGQWVSDADKGQRSGGRLLRLRGAIGPFTTRKGLVLLGIAFAVVFVWSSVHIVPPGNRAVPVFLGDPGGSLGPGIHVTWPFTVTRNINVRTESYTMSAIKGEGARNADDSVAVQGLDGGAAKIDATVLYDVDPEQVGYVYRQVGTNYLEKIVRPSARNCIRSEFTNYDMVEAATSKWHDVEADVAECMASKLEPRGLVLRDFQLREVALSEQLQRAVDAKVAAQQRAEQQRFELAASQQAAEITRVQALANADARQILTCGGEIASVDRGSGPITAIVPLAQGACSEGELTPEYLQFQYIQALRELAVNGNATTLVMPTGSNLTPLVDLGSERSPDDEP